MDYFVSVVDFGSFSELGSHGDIAEISTVELHGPLSEDDANSLALQYGKCATSHAVSKPFKLGGSPELCCNCSIVCDDSECAHY